MNSPLPLPPELTIYTVAELRLALLKALTGPQAESGSADLGAPQADKAFMLDAAPVVQVDTAGLQLLQALARHCKTLALPLKIHKPSAALCAATLAMGMTDLHAMLHAQEHTA